MARRGYSRRPSTCRYCYGSGHTQRTCPKVKEDAANGKSWAQQIIESNKQSIAARSCSYCGEQKHTSRACNKKFNDAATFEKICCEYNDFVKKDMLEKGCTVGSLYRFTPYRYDGVSQPIICYVDKIYEDNMKPTSTWIAKHKLCSGNATQAAAEVEQYRTYIACSKDKKFAKKENGCFVVFRSVSGTGLGYWGDSDMDSLPCDEFLHHYSSSKNRFEVLS